MYIIYFILIKIVIINITQDLLGKSDPYFVVSKRTVDGKWLKVYQSTMIRNTLNPEWPKVDIPLLQLNSGDDKRLLKWDGK